MYDASAAEYFHFLQYFETIVINASAWFNTTDEFTD